MFVAWATTFFGVVFLAVAWGAVVSDHDAGNDWNVPEAQPALTLAVVMQLTGLLIGWFISPELANQPVLGSTVEPALECVFQAVSFVLVSYSALAVNAATGPSKPALRAASITLLLIGLIGLAGFIA